MTKVRSIQQSPSKPLHEGRSAKNGPAQPVDACELFLAELRARRERLQQLLTMVQLEAGRRQSVRAPHHKCTGAHRKAGC